VSYRAVAHLQQKAVPVSRACRLLGVSRSGYYAHRQAQPSPKRLQQQIHVRAAFAVSGSNYGSRRVMHTLQAKGLCIGRHRVRTLMREMDLRASWKRKFVSTTDSRHTLPVAENILDRRFEVAQPNRAWVSDITYIRTARGWLYLAVVLDLYSRKVVGWSMAPTMPADWSSQHWLKRCSNAVQRLDWYSIRTAVASTQAMNTRRCLSRIMWFAA
jgi:putative transposase